MVRNHIEGNPFRHPLFEGVDPGALYEVLCEIHDHPGLEQVYKALYVNVGNRLELFDEESEDFADTVSADAVN
jgi:hypothetical protein